MKNLTRMTAGVIGALAVTGASMGQAISPAQASTRMPDCTSSQLRITTTHPDAALGHEGVTLVFVNTSRTTCAMRGYAGVAGVNSHGRQVVQAQRSRVGYMFPDGRVRTVVLKPGTRATAGLEWIDNPHPDEHPAVVHSLLVTPPNSRTSVRVALPALLIHPTDLVMWPRFLVHPTA